MNKHLGALFWAELTLATLTGLLTVFTLVWPDWIEGVFGLDPDHHSGSIEWELVILCCVAAVLFGTLAWCRWRKASLVSSSYLAP